MLQKLSFGHYFSPSGEIPLEPTPITRKELSLLSLGIIYLLSILAFLPTIWQRKKRTKGTINYLLVPLLFFILAIYYFGIASLRSIKIDRFDLGFYLAYFLIFSIYYIYLQKNTILHFQRISKEDLGWLINEFGKRMQWENPKISKWNGTTEIQNPSSDEVFLFKQNAVQVKHPSSDKRLVKETLLDIFAETRFDWYSFFGAIFRTHVAFILLFFFFFR